MKGKIHYLMLAISLCCLGVFLYVGKEVRTLKKKNKLYHRFFSNVEDGYKKFTPLFGRMAVPYALQNIPYGEDEGVVLRVKDVEIRNVKAPYNATLIEYEEGYLLFFRYDVIQQNRPGSYYTRIGVAKLDSEFNQTQEEFRQIDTGSFHSEDPRILKVGSELYLVFNDLHDCAPSCRTMRIGKVNLSESKLDYVTDLDLQIKPVEKNWVPFEYFENGSPHVYLEYYLNPHKVLRLEDPRVNALTHLVFPSASSFQKLFWSPIWGAPRGGATARKVSDTQYLSFFHSSFFDSNDSCWYIMGAYTFDAEPPFRINAISNYPLLYKGIYESPPKNTADPHKRVVFPGSFVETVEQGKAVLHLACGENDCAVKIISIDKEALLKNMKAI